MRRTVAAFLVAGLVASGVVGIAAPAQAKPKKFSNCTEMHKKYPGGVAKTRKAKNTKTVNGRKVLADSQYKPKVSKKLYNANRGLDRDKDKIACEA